MQIEPDMESVFRDHPDEEAWFLLYSIHECIIRLNMLPADAVIANKKLLSDAVEELILMRKGCDGSGD